MTDAKKCDLTGQLYNSDYEPEWVLKKRNGEPVDIGPRGDKKLSRLMGEGYTWSEEARKRKSEYMIKAHKKGKLAGAIKQEATKQLKKYKKSVKHCTLCGVQHELSSDLCLKCALEVK